MPGINQFEQWFHPYATGGVAEVLFLEEFRKQVPSRVFVFGVESVVVDEIQATEGKHFHLLANFHLQIKVFMC